MITAIGAGRQYAGGGGWWLGGVERRQGLAVEAPELPGCFAHGDTQEAALKQIKRWNFGLTPRTSLATQYRNPRASV